LVVIVEEIKLTAFFGALLRKSQVDMWQRFTETAIVLCQVACVFST